MIVTAGRDKLGSAEKVEVVMSGKPDVPIPGMETFFAHANSSKGSYIKFERPAVILDILTSAGFNIVGQGCTEKDIVWTLHRPGIPATSL